MLTSKVAPLRTMEEEVGSPENKQSTCFSNAVFIGKDNNILSEDVVKKIETAVRERDWVEVISIVKDTRQTVSRTTLKIAVTGDSGNGMSSFINALRLIGHEEENSAPTGVVRTTQKPACYSSPDFPNVDLWDLPGTGVTAQSLENYLEEMEFDTYDLTIIITSEQFSSNHVKLAKAMRRMGRRFYVVWTKLDRDLSTSALSEPELRRSIRESIQENLQNEGLKEVPIFLVSSITPSSYDFPNLRDMLRKDFSNIRYNNLSGVLFQVCEKAIDGKAESIERIIDEDNLHKEFGDLDFNNLSKCQKVFQEIFGVDDTSLRQLALTLGQPEAYYTDAIQSQVPQTCQSTLFWLYYSGTRVLVASFDYIHCQYDSRHFIQTRQKRALDKAAKKTKKILRKILEDPTNN